MGKKSKKERRKRGCMGEAETKKQRNKRRTREGDGSRGAVEDDSRLQPCHPEAMLVELYSSTFE
ncbi:uncharacterized protein G2W53_030106 [Senna tora]|uniref:Uncharacterized protein n=1 Tax=Senna tora TaxID=362788 RepID=A0A834T8P3_9FABA|nr:uncharacterized protein G2W53_030106 [Senna tora]